MIILINLLILIHLVHPITMGKQRDTKRIAQAKARKAASKITNEGVNQVQF